MGIKAALTILSVLIGCLAHTAANAAADARPKDSPAKGEKSCSIGQLTSEFLERQHDDAVAKAGVHFYMKTSSYLRFSVSRSGAITVSIAEDTFPGSKFYFLIDGKRYAGEAHYQLPLDQKALSALKQDKQIDFTYTGWPDRNEMSRQDIFSGFTKAYDECLAFLGGKPKPARSTATTPQGGPVSLLPKN